MSTSTTAVNAAKPWSGGSNGALIRPVDIVPAYLFGPQHKSIAYGLKLDGTVKAQRSVYNDGVVFNEIRRANSHRLRQKFGDAGSDTVRMWLTEKGSNNFQEACRHKFRAKRSLYTEHELAELFKVNAARREEDTKKKYQAQWKSVFALLKLLEREGDRPLGAPPIRIAGGDRALYEQMFRAEPRKHVSHATFLTVMRRVYGFHIAPLVGRVDQSALCTMNEVYNTFDIDGNGKVDWRCMLFMLRTASNAQATVEANLKWGFSLYSSPGSFDPACEDPVSMDDLKYLAFTMTRFDKRVEMSLIFDKAWAEVASNSDEDERPAVQARKEGEGGRALMITMRVLTLMLHQRPLKDLLRPATRFGNRDRGTWTYAIEETFFDPLLLALVKRRRRDERNDRAIALFVSTSRRRTFLVMLAMWKRLVRRRKHCVRLMMRIAGRLFSSNSSSAFRTIQRRAIACKACETIQRMYRGYMGRLVAAFLRDLVLKVIQAQALFRGARQRSKFLSWMSTKHLAATSIQRIIRGALGRKRVRCILQEHFDREMAAVDAEVERLEYRRRHAASSKLQRLWRTRRDSRMNELEKQKRVKVHETEAEMKRLWDSEAREAEVFKRELTAWYKEQKKEQDKSRILEEHTANERFKIMAYRRREKDRLLAETKRRKLAIAEKFEEQRIEQWQMEWAEKAEERALDLRKSLEAILKNPDNPPEKAIQKKMKAEIEIQKKLVFKMANNVEADLEAPEALAIATEDILLRRVDEEREKVNEEMKVAATKYMEEENRAKADKEEKLSKFRDSAADAAARVIQMMYYVSSATRATQRRAKEVYTKHFDLEHLRYYWYNTQIRTFSWEKPNGLGNWDVDPDDRWEVIPGSYELHYYYNPKTYVMQWSKPTDAVICKECDKLFSTRWCTRDAKPYCETCYYNRHFSALPSKGPLSYKELDGAAPGSRDLIQYDFIADQPDISVETLEYIEGEGLEYSADGTTSYSSPNDLLREAQYLDTPGLLERQREDMNTRVMRSTTEGNGSEVQDYFQSQGTYSYDSREGDYVAGDFGAAVQIDGGREHGQAMGQVQVQEYDQMGATGMSGHGCDLFGETQTMILGENSVPVEVSTASEGLATAEENLYDAASFYGLDEGVEEQSGMT